MAHIPHPYLHGELAVAIDCADLDRSAAFWGALLGYVASGPGSERYRHLVPPDGPGIVVVLQRVPDAKTSKSRMHLDLRTRDLTAEIERALKLGATQLTEEPITENGWRWHILADPDGNEFCVLEPPPEHWERSDGGA